jgi:hypothetical protein
MARFINTIIVVVDYYSYLPFASIRVQHLVLSNQWQPSHRKAQLIFLNIKLTSMEYSLGNGERKVDVEVIKVVVV